MPGMDGFEVAQSIRNAPGLAGLTVMMLTSEGRTRDSGRCLELGLASYLVKPIKRAELFAAITAVLNRGRPAARPARAAAPIDGKQRGPRVLLVEDSADNRVLVRSYLKGTPCRMDIAENGQIAVEKFISGHYDLVLMDVEMPVMDGYTATHAIRQWERAQGRVPVPIVALTAYARPEDARRSLEAGCTTHIAKPVRKEQLTETIAALTTKGDHAADAGEARPVAWIPVRVARELADVIPEFLENRRQDVASLREALGRERLRDDPVAGPPHAGERLRLRLRGDHPDRRGPRACGSGPRPRRCPTVGPRAGRVPGTRGDRESSKPTLRLRFWGTRGSLARPGPATVRYGGNTSCVEVRAADGTLIVLDCGRGAHDLGRSLVASEERRLRGHLLITHTHWDHIQGFPFFAPLFVAGHEWDVYAPQGLGQRLGETLAGQMEYAYFPITLAQLAATVRYHELSRGASAWAWLASLLAT